MRAYIVIILQSTYACAFRIRTCSSTHVIHKEYFKLRIQLREKHVQLE